MRGKITKVVLILCLLITIIYADKAQAFSLSSIKDGITSFFIAVNSSIVRMVKDGFCDRYFRDKTEGAYITKIREGSALEICVNYVQKAEKIVEPDKNEGLAQREVKKTSSDKTLSDILKIFSPIEGTSSKVAIEKIDEVKVVENKSEPLIDNTVAVDRSLDLSSLSAQGIISGINNERVVMGFSKLNENALLNKIASKRMNDMFNLGYFEHTSPSGETVGDFAKNESYGYLVIGENIALGDFGSNAELVSAWMASPGHKANILNQNYLETGVAVARNYYQGNQTILAVQVFAKPSKACPLPDENTKSKVLIYNQTIQNLTNSANNIKIELEKMKISGASAVDYNNKVSEYNMFAKLANNLSAEIKSLTESYNVQVGIYNTCVNKI